MTPDERKVLEAYRDCCAADPEGQFSVAYPAIGGSLDDIEVVFAAAKSLKRQKFLDGETGRGRMALITSSYWITDKGILALSHD